MQVDGKAAANCAGGSTAGTLSFVAAAWDVHRINARLIPDTIPTKRQKNHHRSRVRAAAWRGCAGRRHPRLPNRARPEQRRRHARHRGRCMLWAVPGVMPTQHSPLQKPAYHMLQPHVTQATPRCAAFSFVMPNIDTDAASATGQCWLYDAYTTTSANPRVVSGIRPHSTAPSRRRLQTTSCPSAVLPLPAGTNMSALQPSQLNGLTWQQVCCANAAVSNCTSLPEDTTLLLPCGESDPLLAGSGCPATGTATVEVTQLSTNWGLALGAGLGACAAGLLLGLLAGWFAAWLRIRRRHTAMVLKASGLEDAHAIAKGGGSPPSSKGGSKRIRGMALCFGCRVCVPILCFVLLLEWQCVSSTVEYSCVAVHDCST